MTGQFPLRNAAVTALFGLAISSCAQAPSPLIKTANDPTYVRYRNILVIGAASDHDARALFERQVASAISNRGSNATPYFAIAGRAPLITRNGITNAIRSRGFDAVLLTRLKGQERAGTAVGELSVSETRFNPFRFDYAALNNPLPIDTLNSVNLVTELWSAANQRRVWAVESVRSAANMSELIEIEASAIARELRKDKKIGS